MIIKLLSPNMEIRVESIIDQQVL